MNGRSHVSGETSRRWAKPRAAEERPRVHEKARRAASAHVAQRVVVEEDPPAGIVGIGRICRIHGRQIYRVLGAGNRRRRRITSTEVLMRCFVSLDYVPEHPRLPIEPEKVAAFEAPQIDRRILPQRVYRRGAGNLRCYFPLRLLVALDDVRAVFVYVDPSHEIATALRSCGVPHGELWMALWDCGRKLEVVAVSRTMAEWSRARTVLANWACHPRPSEIDQETDHEIARIQQAIVDGDVRVLREY